MRNSFCFKSAHKAKKSITRAANLLSVGQDKVMSFLIRGRNGTQKIKGRFPDCVKGISAIAGDCQGTIISAKEVNHDPAKGHDQQFFYSHL